MNVHDLTLRQKIGQMALCSLDGGTVDAKAEALLRDFYVGNIIHFGNNVFDFRQAKRLNAELTQVISRYCAGIPPILGVDHEGGRVMRFGAGFTWFPSQMALGAADDEELTLAVGRAMGEELRAAGFTLSFSPVLDVLGDAKSFIGIRAFGNDPALVARHGAALARGLQSAGVMACCKHFPGHGDTQADSHYGLPKVDKPRAALEAMELHPYADVIRQDAADAVMTAHILFPALEGREVPATMSRAVVSGTLREDLGFSGMVVTDGMQMKAVAAHYGMARGCVEAVLAGCDLLAVGTGGAGSGREQAECLEAVYQAVLSGEIPMERIDDSVSRILRLKAKYLAPGQHAEPDFAAHGRLNHAACAKSATRLHGPITGDALRGRVLCVSAPVKELAFGLSHADPRSLTFAQMAGEALGAEWMILDSAAQIASDVAHTGEATGGSTAVMDGSRFPSDFDTLLLGVNTLQENSPEFAAARAAIKQGKRAAFVHLGVPGGREPWPEQSPAVALFCLTPASVQAAIDVLTGRAEARGKLPVKSTD